MKTFFLKKFTIYSLFISLITATLSAQIEKPDALKSYNEGKYKEAIEICQNELKSNPNNLDSYAVMCWALVSNKQYSEAEQQASAARRINPYDVRIMEILGEAKYYLGKNNEALSMLQTYIANVPENGSRFGRAYFLMGEIYIRQSKFQHADIAFTTAVRSEPLMDYWWTRLGYAREMAADYKNAIVAYDKAISINSAQRDASLGKTRCQQHL